MYFSLKLCVLEDYLHSYKYQYIGYFKYVNLTKMDNIHVNDFYTNTKHFLYFDNLEETKVECLNSKQW